MEKVQFTIEAEPVPASRPKVNTRTGVSYYPKKHTAYAGFLGDVLKNIPGVDPHGPVRVSMKFVMPRYKTSDHPVHRSDVDNLSKLPMDCMTKAEKFWVDDCYVVDLRSYKRFARDGEEPHTQIKVTRINQSVEDYIDEAFEND